MKFRIVSISIDCSENTAPKHLSNTCAMSCDQEEDGLCRLICGSVSSTWGVRTRRERVLTPEPLDMLLQTNRLLLVKCIHINLSHFMYSHKLGDSVFILKLKLTLVITKDQLIFPKITNCICTLPDQKYLHNQNFEPLVPQVAHDRDTMLLH